MDQDEYSDATGDPNPAIPPKENLDRPEPAEQSAPDPHGAIPAADEHPTLSPEEGNFDAGFRGLANQLAKLERSFDQKVKYDQSREAIIEQLHDELQQYKADFYLKVIAPLVDDLITLHVDLGKTAQAHQDDAIGNEPAAKLLDLFSQFQTDVEILLERYGFTSFVVPSNGFDPKLQRATQRVVTDDPLLDLTVKCRFRNGVMYEDRVIRRELVAVYAYEK